MANISNLSCSPMRIHFRRQSQFHRRRLSSLMSCARLAGSSRKWMTGYINAQGNRESARSSKAYALQCRASWLSTTDCWPCWNRRDLSMITQTLRTTSTCENCTCGSKNHLSGWSGWLLFATLLGVWREERFALQLTRLIWRAVPKPDFLFQELSERLLAPYSRWLKTGCSMARSMTPTKNFS